MKTAEIQPGFVYRTRGRYGDIVLVTEVRPGRIRGASVWLDKDRFVDDENDDRELIPFDELALSKSVERTYQPGPFCELLGTERDYLDAQKALVAERRQEQRTREIHRDYLLVVQAALKGRGIDASVQGLQGVERLVFYADDVTKLVAALGLNVDVPT